MEKEGKCFLHIKTIERAHLPAHLWEEIYLGDNFKNALSIIDQHLAFWSKNELYKVKQRLVKIWQYLIRMRDLRKILRPEIVPINKKVERREKTREYKALKAAKLELEIKKELLERLNQSDIYGDIYNFAPNAFKEVLDEHEIEPLQEEIEFVEGEYEDELYQSQETGTLEDRSRDQYSSEEDNDEDGEGDEDKKKKEKENKSWIQNTEKVSKSDQNDSKRSGKRRDQKSGRKRAHIQIEMEQEMEMER